MSQATGDQPVTSTDWLVLKYKFAEVESAKGAASLWRGRMRIAGGLAAIATVGSGALLMVGLRMRRGRLVALAFRGEAATAFGFGAVAFWTNHLQARIEVSAKEIEEKARELKSRMDSQPNQTSGIDGRREFFKELRVRLPIDLPRLFKHCTSKEVKGIEAVINARVGDLDLRRRQVRRKTITGSLLAALGGVAALRVMLSIYQGKSLSLVLPTGFTTFFLSAIGASVIFAEGAEEKRQAKECKILIRKTAALNGKCRRANSQELKKVILSKDKMGEVASFSKVKKLDLEAPPIPGSHGQIGVHIAQPAPPLQELVTLRNLRYLKIRESSGLVDGLKELNPAIKGVILPEISLAGLELLRGFSSLERLGLTRIDKLNEARGNAIWFKAPPHLVKLTLNTLPPLPASPADKAYVLRTFPPRKITLIKPTQADFPLLQELPGIKRVSLRAVFSLTDDQVDLLTHGGRIKEIKIRRFSNVMNTLTERSLTRLWNYGYSVRIGGADEPLKKADMKQLSEITRPKRVRLYR